MLETLDFLLGTLIGLDEKNRTTIALIDTNFVNVCGNVVM